MMQEMLEEQQGKQQQEGKGDGMKKLNIKLQSSDGKADEK